MILNILCDEFLAIWQSPFMKPIFRIMNIAVEKPPVIRKKQDLPNRGTCAFGDHAIDQAFALRHPGAWKSHTYLNSGRSLQNFSFGSILLVFNVIDRLGM